MDAYTDFASVYDTFMDETPYEEWAEFIHKLIKEYGISDLATDKDRQMQIHRNYWIRRKTWLWIWAVAQVP